jgi:hypothetical protein
MQIRFPFLIALLLITAVTALPQDDDVVRVNTELVLLNLTVTDKSGQYVKGLKAADFKVYEDGVEVKPELIASFSLQESPYAAVVLLDSSGSMEARFTLARSAFRLEGRTRAGVFHWQRSCADGLRDSRERNDDA